MTFRKRKTEYWILTLVYVVIHIFDWCMLVIFVKYYQQEKDYQRLDTRRNYLPTSKADGHE